MADPVSSAAPVSLPLTSPDSGSTPEKETTVRKINPNSEDEITQAALDAFLPGMITNQLMLNNTLFNFAKEAIDEADA